MNPSDKRILRAFLLGLTVAFLINYICDAIDYRTHGAAWRRVAAAGFDVPRNNVWWNLWK